MSKTFHSAALAAHNAISGHRGYDVVYARGQETAAITAVAGQSRVIVEDSAGVSIRARRRDWLVRAADLVMGGEVVLPQVGDRVLLTVGEAVQVYEVQRLAGEGCYAASDDLGQVLRIHTRQIEGN